MAIPDFINDDSSRTNSTVPINIDELEKLRNQISELSKISPNAHETIPKTYATEPIQVTSSPIEGAFSASEKGHKNAAMDIVRSKLAKLYAKEPDATEEAIESFQAGAARSKHQEYMYQLTNSGQGLAQIQTQWHNYYTALPDNEKHEVWQEFYSAHEHNASSDAKRHTNATAFHKSRKKQKKLEYGEPNDTRTVADIKKHVINRVSAGGKLKAKHHFQSLLFGMGMASIFAVVLLFGFFNERFIAPFISPSREVAATPIVGNSGIVGPEPKIIIPKINLEVPVVYDLNTTDEKVIQNGLENGVVHYSTSPNPGQTGNIVIVGHSSNNILNKGKYKFAFVLLKKLEIGDTFSLQKDGVRYTYQIFEKKIVKPNDVGVLGPSAKPNTATLITCDPPGTSISRLVVVGEQISPDPSSNKVSEQKTPELTNTGILPSNAPSLWQRIKSIF